LNRIREMPESLRNVIALVVVLFAALIVGNAFQHQWQSLFVPKESYPMSVSVSWLSPWWLVMTWGYDLFIGTISGVALALLLVPSAELRWYAYLGVAIGGLRLVSVLAQSPEASSSMESLQRVWLDCGYLMPMIGIAAGAACAKWSLRRRRPRADDAHA